LFGGMAADGLGAGGGEEGDENELAFPDCKETRYFQTASKSLFFIYNASTRTEILTRIKPINISCAFRLYCKTDITLIILAFSLLDFICILK
jgi:hypothetical protein